MQIITTFLLHRTISIVIMAITSGTDLMQVLSVNAHLHNSCKQNRAKRVCISIEEKPKRTLSLNTFMLLKVTRKFVISDKVFSFYSALSNFL